MFLRLCFFCYVLFCVCFMSCFVIFVLCCYLVVLLAYSFALFRFVFTRVSSLLCLLFMFVFYMFTCISGLFLRLIRFICYSMSHLVLFVHIACVFVAVNLLHALFSDKTASFMLFTFRRVEDHRNLLKKTCVRRVVLICFVMFVSCLLVFAVLSVCLLALDR